jgi:hypothetical protein
VTRRDRGPAASSRGLRPLIERRRRARARVRILPAPHCRYARDGSVASAQVAEVTLPRWELDRIWSPEHLERLARTYWAFLTRFFLGLLRVEYGPCSREVVLLTRPFVLLRFSAPQYEFAANRGTVTWPIERGMLVAPAGRGRGYLRLSVERLSAEDGGGEVTARVSSEVVSFYPLLAELGANAPTRWFSRIGRFIYEQTQLRIHVIVTNAFLRSLANLELEPSVVGALRPGASAPTPASRR